MPRNVLPLHLKQTFPSIIWIFTEGEGDGIESRLPFKIFSTLILILFSIFHYFSILDSQYYPAPSEDCRYEVFDMLKNPQVENYSYAIYHSNQKVLELINVETETPYILKQDGKNMSKLITVLTSNHNQFTQILNVTSDSSPQNVSFSVSQRFLSYLLIKGKENLKIDDFRLIIFFSLFSLPFYQWISTEILHD